MRILHSRIILGFLGSACVEADNLGGGGYLIAFVHRHANTHLLYLSLLFYGQAYTYALGPSNR